MPKKPQDMSDEELFEVLDAENDTEFATSDLVEIIRSVDGPWSEPMTAEEVIEDMRQLFRSNGIELPDDDQTE